MDTSSTAHPEVAVDLVLLSWAEDPDGPLKAQLQVGLIWSTAVGPGGWALPGAYVQHEQTVRDAVGGVFGEKVGLPPVDRLMHLPPFSEPGRDPRRRTISLPVLALLPNRGVPRDAFLGTWATLRSDVDPPALAIDDDPVDLLFDHADIVATALAELRRRLQADDLHFLTGLLAPRFALRELERVWNAISGEEANTPSFRRRMTGLKRPGTDRQPWLEETEETGAQSSGRPAKLYRWT
ncbi:MAG TPA: hypothetical protein VMM13_03450 [Euzebya sp.]|nr:hypothetical protein [Euzebya sp.]